MNIYNLLLTKKNNQHYLNRYYKFIHYCRLHNKNNNDYCEVHHICPKSNDLFPEYSSFKLNPWNKIKLTTRQHFICHYLLHKSYGGRQSYSFWCMCNGQKNKHQSKRYDKINSRIYENVKKDAKKVHIGRRGKASYIDKNGNKIYCSTNDYRVISGELISLSAGRKYKWNHSGDHKRIYNLNLRKRSWRDKVVNLYFLEIKISLKVTFGMPEIIPYLDQGWSLRRTKEHHSMTAINSNKNRNIKYKKREN